MLDVGDLTEISIVVPLSDLRIWMRHLLPGRTGRSPSRRLSVVEVDEEGKVVRGLDEVALSSITPKKGAELYAGLRRRKTKGGTQLAVDSHRNILAEAKSFLKWCAGKKWIVRNPLDEVEGVGKRRHGKEQLRIDEARRWQAKAIEFADRGKEERPRHAGLHGTLAVDSGITSHAVAAALGHESFRTTAESYAQLDKVASAQQKRVLGVLSGGRIAS